VAADQQAGDREHLGVGDHVGEDDFRLADCGGQAAVPVLPAFGERGVPSRCQPLAGDVYGLPVGAGDVRAGDVRGAPVVASLAFCDLGQGRQARTVDAARVSSVAGEKIACRW
jgi:hypothetical protein